MKTVLLSKLKNLLSGDDGAALVITLGVFFFMYIFCAGVYAIGFAVKEKIHLQNACDAAAYSAAVVQADTISRIATLNRAMGWTYAQMCKRQMDYIVYRWLEHTVAHYNADLIEARGHVLESVRHKHDGRIVHGEYGFSEISLNHGAANQSPADLINCYSGMSDWIRRNCSESMYKTSGYAIAGLEEQIYNDKETILRMNAAFDTYLNGLPTRVDNAVNAVLKANVPAYMRDDCRYVVRQEQEPNANLLGFLNNTATDERTFVLWGGGGWQSDTQPYGIGSGDSEWYVRTGSGRGLQRAYNFGRLGALVASWSWWAWYCSGCTIFGLPSPVRHGRTCSHGADDARCRCSASVNHSSWTYADSRHLLDGKRGYKQKSYRYYYTGERAYPRMLLKTYFGPRGTISVGLAKQNTNPFFSVFRSAMGTGFYSAFRPYNDWTWCFSSAKAGYKLYELPEEEAADGADTLGWEARHNGRPRAFREPRDYCIDWKPLRMFRSNYVRRYRDVYENGVFVRREWDSAPVRVRTEAEIPSFETNGWKLERDARGKLVRQLRPTYWRQSWNLTQSDWDAVLLPVRQGGSEAVEDNTNTHLAWMESVRDREKLYSYEPVWGNRNDSFVADLVGDAGWKDLDGRAAANGRFGDMFAGGEHDPDPNDDWGDNFITRTSAGWSGWWDIPKTAADHPEDQSEKVQCRWNIGTPHGKLKWREITKMMFH